MESKSILVLAYAISPTKGSEYSVAWNYVRHMSKHCRLTVLYGVSGEHMGDCEEIRNFVAEGGLTNVKFVCVEPSGWANLLNWCNRHGFMGYTFYWAYHAWHKLAYNKAKELMKEDDFDLVHFVGPISYREPGFLWKLGLPYLWGPIGGCNSTNMVLQKHTSKKTRIKFIFRNVVNEIQLRCKIQLRLAMKHTDLLLTATTENQRKIANVLKKNSIYLPENSITTEIKLDRTKFDNPDKYHFIVVGSLIPRKAVHIVLEAMMQMKNLTKFHLDIVGDGFMRTALEQYANVNNLSNYITWYGQLPRAEAVQLFRMAHAHLVVSLSEGNPTTIWEAMSYGVPTISFDHCGMHDTICEKCGIKIPITTYEQSVSELAVQMQDLLDQPQRFLDLAEGTIQCAKKNLWNDREQFLLQCYEETLDNYMKKRWTIIRENKSRYDKIVI